MNRIRLLSSRWLMVLVLATGLLKGAAVAARPMLSPPQPRPVRGPDATSQATDNQQGGTGEAAPSELPSVGAGGTTR